MEIIKPHQTVSETRQFLSLESSAQLLIASAGFLSIKNEHLSIVVCHCQSTVEGGTLTSCSDPDLCFVLMTLFLTLNICEISPKVIFKDILVFIKIMPPPSQKLVDGHILTPKKLC